MYSTYEVGLLSFLSAKGSNSADSASFPKLYLYKQTEN